MGCPRQWFSGEKNLRHAPYFRSFVSLYLLKKGFALYLTNLDSTSHKDVLYQVWLNGPIVLKQKSKLWKLSRQMDARTDNRQQVIRTAQLNLRLRWTKTGRPFYCITEPPNYLLGKIVLKLENWVNLPGFMIKHKKPYTSRIAYL